MTRRAVRTVLAIGAVGGQVEALERLLAAPVAAEADAIAVVGDLGAPLSTGAEYRAIFRVLGSATRPTFWVPGALDAPARRLVGESPNLEIVYPHLHDVHGRLSFAPGFVVFAGMGGDVVDDGEWFREEEGLLRHAGWEVEHRFNALREFDEHPKVFLFTTPPAHERLGPGGSSIVAHLIARYGPRLAVVAGDEPRQLRLGDTLVVSPGRLDRGGYHALVDLSSGVASVAMLTGARGRAGAPVHTT